VTRVSGDCRERYVDDDDGVRSLLSSSEWIICGEAGDDLDAVQNARSIRPDLGIMDIFMLRMDGVAARRIMSGGMRLVVEIWCEPCLTSAIHKLANGEGPSLSEHELQIWAGWQREQVNGQPI
jgi:hypothetical protein